jgi:type IX secretion system PorP/SprF family membrane protein
MKRTMKKYLVIAWVLLLAAQIGHAQPMFQFSQYMFNDYALNPAIGGTHDYWQIRSNYRLQWAGLPDGPQTYMLGAYGPHKTMPMGYGGYIFNDIVGAVSYLGMYGSYAYNIKISGDIRLSMGLLLGVVQQKVDFSVLSESDPIFTSGTPNKFIPDGTLGVYLYTSQYFAGVTMTHLFFNNLSLLSEYDEGFNTADARLKPYFNIQGGYKYNINRNFDLEPSVLMKASPNFDFITDINIRTIYQKMVWGGLGLRYNFKNLESLIVLVGYNYNDLVNIGYSYDIGLSNLSKTSYGSHEVMIGVKFDDIRKSKSRRKIR